MACDFNDKLQKVFKWKMYIFTREYGARILKKQHIIAFAKVKFETNVWFGERENGFLSSHPNYQQIEHTLSNVSRCFQTANKWIHLSTVQKLILISMGLKCSRRILRKCKINQHDWWIFLFVQMNVIAERQEKKQCQVVNRFIVYSF